MKTQNAEFDLNRDPAFFESCCDLLFENLKMKKKLKS
jgi:hypothetical protein